MATLYDEDEYGYLELEMYNAQEVAEKGDMAKIEKGQYEELPSPDIIAAEAKKRGFDTFEVTTVTGKIKRYSVE